MFDFDGWGCNRRGYPEPGIRLIKLDRIDEFNESLETYQSQLEAGVQQLNDHYAEMMACCIAAAVAKRNTS